MLTVSLAAGSYVAELLDEVEAPEGVAVRLKWERGQRVALRLDRPQAEDIQIRHGNRVILLLEPKIKQRLKGLYLQLASTARHSRLTFAKKPLKNDRMFE